jgi:hypothetical protein
MAEKTLDLGADLEAQDRVEVGEWLVKKDGRRAVRDRSSERDALLLTTRQRARHPLCEIAQIDQREASFHDLGAPLLTRESERHVASHGEMGKQSEILKDHSHAPLFRRYERGRPT